MANRIQLRKDLAANWANVNPRLEQGEPGFELDTGLLKIGPEGGGLWNELPYFNPSQLPPDAQGYLTNDGEGNLTWGPGDGTFSGDYRDLTHAPTIPTDVNQLTDTDGLLGGGSGSRDRLLSPDGSQKLLLDNDGIITLPGVPDPNLFSDQGSIKFNASDWLVALTVGSSTSGNVPGCVLGFKFDKTLYDYDFTTIKVGDYIYIDQELLGFPPGGLYSMVVAVSEQDPNNANLWMVGQNNTNATQPEGTTIWLPSNPAKTSINNWFQIQNNNTVLSDGPLHISASGSPAWTFDTDGTLTAPNNSLTITPSNGSPTLLSSPRPLEIVSTGGESFADFGWIDRLDMSATKAAGMVAGPIFNNNANTYIYTGNLNGPLTDNVWTFGADGTTVFPNNNHLVSDNLSIEGDNLSLKSDNFSIAVYPSTITLTGADHAPCNGTYILEVDSSPLIWYKDGNNTNQQYIIYDNGWTAITEDINSDPIYVNSGKLYSPNAQWDLGYSGGPAPTGTYTFIQWNFDSQSNLTLPAGGDIVDINGNSVLPQLQGKHIVTRFEMTSVDNYTATVGDWTTEVGPDAMVNIVDGTVDDSNISTGTLPFNVSFNDVSYDQIYIGSNSYLTFGGGSNRFTITGPGSANAHPAIFISAADNSYQRIYTLVSGTSGTRSLRIRFEGTNNTVGIAGEPTIVWEAVFYENIPNTFDIIVLKDARDGDGVTGISNGTSWIQSRPTIRTSLPVSDKLDRFTKLHFAGNIDTAVVNGVATITIPTGLTDRLTSPNGQETAVLGDNGQLQMPQNSTLWFNYGYLGQSQTFDNNTLRLSGGDSVSIYTNEDGIRWIFDATGKLTLPAGGDILDSNGNSVLGGGGSSTLIGDELTNVETNLTDGKVYIRTFDALRQQTNEWSFDQDGVMYAGGENNLIVNGINGKSGNDLTLNAGGPERLTRLIKFTNADGTSKRVYTVDGLTYQVNDILISNAYIWYSLGNSMSIDSIVDNNDGTWTVTFSNNITLAADTEYTVEWFSNHYNDVRIATNSGQWTFENAGGLRFNDGSRQWTAANAIAEALPYSIDINTYSCRIIAYGTAQAEIDPGIMTPVSLPGNTDDNYVTLDNLPFNVKFLNQSYALLGVGSNSYVTFGGVTNHYNFGDDPTMGGANLPAIIISEADNSFQRVYKYVTGSSGSREFSIRYEGTNQTAGVPGQSNIIWQITFYESNPDVISLLLIQDARNNRGISGITNGNYWQLQTEDGVLLPRLPWNQFAPRSVHFTNSSISIDSNNNATIDVAGGGTTNEIINTNSNNTYSVSVGTDGVITMTTSRGTLEVGALPEPGGPSHLHVMKAAGNNNDLYFGDDFNYVLQRGPAYSQDPAYGVEIGTNDNNGGSQQVWRFGTDGNLTFPGDIVAQEVNDLNLKVFNPTGGGVTISLQNRNIDSGSKTTQLDLAPDDIVLITDFAGAKNEWTFGNDGSLTVPGNIQATTGNDITISSGSNTGGTAASIVLHGAGGEGGNDNTNPLSGNIEIIAGVDGGYDNDNLYPGMDIGNIKLRTSSYIGQNVNEWKFDKNGILELPNNGTILQTGSYSRTTDAFVIDTDTNSIVWTALQTDVSSVKLVIQTQSLEDGDNTGLHYQVCEAIIASRGRAASVGFGEPVMTVYGVTHTSTVPLATFTVQRNAITKMIEVVATRTAATLVRIDFKIHSVEMIAID